MELIYRAPQSLSVSMQPERLQTYRCVTGTADEVMKRWINPIHGLSTETIMGLINEDRIIEQLPEGEQRRAVVNEGVTRLGEYQDGNLLVVCGYNPISGKPFVEVPGIVKKISETSMPNGITIDMLLSGNHFDVSQDLRNLGFKGEIYIWPLDFKPSDRTTHLI